MPRSLRYAARLAVPVILAAATGCDWMDLDEKDTCATLPPTQPEDLTTGPFMYGEEMSFCDVIVPFQPEVYTMRTMPTLIEEIDGFHIDWTFPEGVSVVSDDGSGAFVRWGEDGGGQVCGRAWNECTEPGEFACREVTMLTENVWAGSNISEAVFEDGAAVAVANGFIYAMNPLNRYVVWKGDPETATWEKVADTFPVGDAASNDYTRGEAIADSSGNIYYLALRTLFRFDTTTNTWSTVGELPDHQMGYGASVEIDGKLWVMERGNQGAPGEFWVFDPSDRSMTRLGGAILSDNIVAFERNGHLVIGGGNFCDVNDARCWSDEFFEFDPATYESFTAPYRVPDGEMISTALDFDGFTVLIDRDGTMYRLDDTSDELVPMAINPNYGCRIPIRPAGGVGGATVVVDGKGWVIGGEGQETGIYIYFP